MGKRTLLADGREEMLQINVRQKDFYESRFEAAQAGRPGKERAANAPTNIWTLMRRKVLAMRRASGAEEYLYILHRDWMSNLKVARVLDLGCFTGNHLSLWIAEHCAEYVGMDLSEQAIYVLNAKLRERQLTHASASAQDFLANSYPDNYFDLVYAFSVLHHFKDVNSMLQEMCRILKPGGVVISFDPLMTEPFNRLARIIYRPLQSDRDWEWPFTRTTFRIIRKYFEIADMQGFLGMTKLGFPFQLLPGLNKLGEAIVRWGLEFDKEHARSLGFPFYLCWMATLQLRKPLTN